MVLSLSLLLRIFWVIRSTWLLFTLVIFPTFPCRVVLFFQTWGSNSFTQVTHTFTSFNYFFLYYSFILVFFSPADNVIVSHIVFFFSWIWLNCCWRPSVCTFVQGFGRWRCMCTKCTFLKTKQILHAPPVSHFETISMCSAQLNTASIFLAGHSKEPLRGCLKCVAAYLINHKLLSWVSAISSSGHDGLHWCTKTHFHNSIMRLKPREREKKWWETMWRLKLEREFKEILFNFTAFFFVQEIISYFVYCRTETRLVLNLLLLHYCSFWFRFLLYHFPHVLLFPPFTTNSISPKLFT